MKPRTTIHVLLALMLVWLGYFLWAVTVTAQTKRQLHIECHDEALQQGACIQETKRLRFTGDWSGVELCNADRSVCIPVP